MKNIHLWTDCEKAPDERVAEFENFTEKKNNKLVEESDESVKNDDDTTELSVFEETAPEEERAA